MPFTIRSIHWQRDVQGLLQVWRDGLPGGPRDRHVLALAYLEAFHQRIVASGGAPPLGAVVNPKEKPPGYWVELTGGWWLHCAIVERKRGPFSAGRTVKIINLVSRPPTLAN